MNDVLSSKATDPVATPHMAWLLDTPFLPSKISRNAAPLFERIYVWILSTGTLRRKHLILLFTLGLLIRAAGLFGLGDGDMEHFKAWAVLTQTKGLHRMYGASDSELLAYAKDHDTSVVQSFNSNRTWVRYAPLASFSAGEYMVLYPPGSVYLLHLSGMAYRRFSPQLVNSRWFNAFISFPMLLASIAVTFLVFSFLRKENHELAVASALMYWLNPIILLDSPIQGYNNPVFALLGLLTGMLLYRKRYFAAVCIATLGAWVKPQGLLLVPLVAVVCIKETRFRMWGMYLLAALAVSFIVLLPFVWAGYTISALLGATAAVRDLGVWTVEVLSARSWNVWWPIHVATYNLFGVESVRVPNFSSHFGVNPKIIASTLLALVCGLSLAKLFTKLPAERIYIFLCMIMLGYAYTMIQINVQFNQFLIFIPTLLLVTLASSPLFAMALLISIPWLVQLFAYGGLGRDLCCPSNLFSPLGLTAVFTGGTLLISLANVVLWLSFCRHYFAESFTKGRRLSAFKRGSMLEADSTRKEEANTAQCAGAPGFSFPTSPFAPTHLENKTS